MAQYILDCHLDHPGQQWSGLKQKPLSYGVLNRKHNGKNNRLHVHPNLEKEGKLIHWHDFQEFLQ